VEQEADDAAEYSLFDVPFMVADGRAFLGVDRTEFLDRFLVEKAA
jgi:2-hydroxychromene-2-carboxylate isomerase